ncbi:MAG: TetR/AcrR family transcriptional regulator [Thalassovita sp.]|nr:TetR/AcrR family transcriptional regulator [Thalassovita sp.]
MFYIHEDDSPGKAKILTEGLRLFAENGLSATSIRDIATAAGLSNPALYKHFKTKHDLALVLFERSYLEILRRLTKATQQETGFPGKFRDFIRTYLQTYDDNPHVTLFTTDNLAALWPDVSEQMKGRTVISLLREILEHGRSDGFVTLGEDLDLQLALVVGMLGQTTRQMYFRTLTGPAHKHADGIERILRAGLS